MSSKDKKEVLRKIATVLCTVTFALHLTTLIGYIVSTVNTESPFGSIYIPVSAICTVLSGLCFVFILKRKKEVSFPLAVISFIVSLVPLGFWTLFARAEDLLALPFVHVFTRFIVISLSLLSTVFLGVYNEKPKDYEHHKPHRDD